MSETNSAQDVSRTTSRSTTKGMDDQERNRSGLPPGIQGDFIKATPEPSSGEFHEHVPDRLRRVVKRFTQNSATTQVMAGVVLFDAYCNCADIDARADGGSSPPLVLQLGAIFCLVLYSLEAILILYSQGRSALRDVIFLIDLSVILCGYAEIILSELLASEELAARISPLRLLRLARVMRLLRLLRKTRALRELQKLVIMMSTCIKALLWSFIFCFIVMTVWAMLIVEMINPIIKEMNGASGAFADCDECLRATSSVMNANLLLFKTVIAGDSWGQIAVPVIQEHPATAIIFMGSLLTLVFGVLNLIVAVVVDTFADARDRDILNLAEEMEQDVEADRRYLERMFERIDYEHTGQLSLEQLVEGARRDAEFQSRLRVMDIDEHDLVQLFDMIDTDGSGFIESAEFVRPLSRWVHDSRTAPRFIKYNLVRALQKQDEIQAEQEIMKKEMQSNFQELLQRLEDLQPEPQKADLLVNVRAPSWERLKTESMELVSWTPIAKRHESIEQPQPCRRVTLKKLAESEAGVHEAMARLEQLVLHATEMAMKETTGLIKEVLLDCGSLSQELPKAHLAVDLKAD